MTVRSNRSIGRIVVYSMKTKVLYSNGKQTVELFWVTHTGKDVYCGVPKSNFKRSYHASGKLHSKEGSVEKDASWASPLKEVKGHFHLGTIGLSNSREWPKKTYARLEVFPRKVDGAIFIDSRSIPEKQIINVSVGLLEPHNFPALDRLIRALGNVRQLHLSTDSTPWICCMVMWPVNLFEEAQQPSELD